MNYAKGLFLKVKKIAFSAEEDINAAPFISAADCHACTTPCTEEDHPHYPSYLKINHDMPLLYSVKPYTRHVLISTGKEDWEPHIDDDKASLAHHMSKAIDEGQQRLRAAGIETHGKILLTNSSRLAEDWEGSGWQIMVNNVTIEQCRDFFDAFLAAPVGEVGMDSEPVEGIVGGDRFQVTTEHDEDVPNTPKAVGPEDKPSPSPAPVPASPSTPNSRTIQAGGTTFVARQWLPKAAIMICSHKKRDKRCGVTAPILGKEFKRILRSKDLYGDAEGDVEIWMVSHIGGHKFAGNVIVHRSDGMAVWYGRVEPCHCQAIVDATIERGEVIRELYRGSMKGSFASSKKSLAW
ncbi:hypothetical protein BGZ93_005301 [Podila epicladia]|nr:hypothetical protein BGZ92_011407 [Podila epicladia]KAG0100735.1 hypothetical protein BGZ93_005301 [Podila epicladia]